MLKDTRKLGTQLHEVLDLFRGAPDSHDPCTALESGLARLQGLLNLDHVGIYLIGDDYAHPQPTLVWPRSHARPDPTPGHPLAWLVAQAGNAEVLSIRSTTDLPDDAGPEKAWFARQEWPTVVLVPIRHQGALAGFLCLVCAAGDDLSWVDPVRGELVTLADWLGRVTPNLQPPVPPGAAATLLRRLVTATEDLSACQDATSVQKRAVEQAVRALGMERCRIYLPDETKGYRGRFVASAPTGRAALLEETLPAAWHPARAWFDALATGGGKWTRVAGCDDLTRGRDWVAVTAVMRPYHAAPQALLVTDGAASGRPINGLRQEALVQLADVVGRALDRCWSAEKEGVVKATSRRNERLESMAGMAGVLAHDLNNLLMPVIGYSKLVADGLDERNQLRGEALEILRAAEEVSELATRLLAVGRRRMRQLGVSDLGRLVAEQRGALNEALGQSIRLSIHTAEALPLIQADPDTLLDMLRNVLLNAQEALPEGGHVRIKAETCHLGEEDCTAHVQVRPGEYVRITIEDDGPGMSPEVAAHAFDPFFTTKKRRGAGLGLPTVYGAVRQCGGCVDLDSRLGRGTRIDLILPLARRPDAPAPVPPRPRPGDETILVVEDEDRVRRVVVHMLESLGYNVLQAASGSDAVACARAHQGPLHLVLSDVVMPGMDGRETAEQLRQLRQDFRTLFMSGYADADLGDPELDVLRKPFTAETLGTRVREILDS
jgi:signal transduction histidine kinase